MTRAKQGIFWCVGCLVLFFCAGGCASLQEKGKQIWGSSVTHLENARSSGMNAQVEASAHDVFKKTEDILVAHDAVVYLKDKDEKYLAAMNFKGHVDTTQAGIFFTRISDTSTKVEVASMSPRLVEEVSVFLFFELSENSGSINTKGE